MKRTCTRVLRSALSLVLVFCLTLSFCGAAFAVETEETGKTIKYVSLGASNTNGYGLRGYLDEAVTKDPLAASKADMNVYGYLMTPDAAYPAQIAAELEVAEEDFHQLAISSMRTEEVLYLLGDEYDYVNDAYMQWRFTGGEKWFEIAEPGGVDALQAAYENCLTDADVITIDLGWNNFGVYAFNNIKTILADGTYWKAPDFDATKAVSEAEYNEIRRSVENYLKDNITDDAALNSKMTQMLDVLTYATLGAIVHFDSIVGQIYEWNPDAQIVVINIQNLADDLVVEFEGATLELGNLYGELIDLVNLYRASESPYADQYAFADAGDVETFLDEIVAWDGATSLGDNMKDCFDMYDDSLYVRSIVEYTMVGQALSAVFASVRADFKEMGISAFVDDDDYTFEFKFDEAWLENAQLDKLNLQTPSTDLEKYGAAVAKHMVKLRAEEYGAYDYIFENVIETLNTQGAPYTDYISVVEQGQEDFKGALRAVHTTYVNTLDYAYDVVATIMQYAAKIDAIEVNAGSLNGFNTKANELVTYIANSFIDGATQMFGYELQKNGVLDTGITVEPVFEIDEERFEDPAIRAIAVLAVRYELGNSFFAHPNETGHDQITNAVLDALKSSDAGDFTDGKLTLYKTFLQERYPNLYALIMGAQNVGQMDDLAIIINLLKVSGNPALTAAELDALEANIRAAQRDYAESKTPEQQARAEEVAYDLMQRLYDLAAVTSGSNYVVTEDSYYVSLGDSTISGYGLSGYIDGMQNGVNQVVAGSAHVLLAQEIYGEEWKSHFGNFCQGSLRADDLLLFLGGDVELDNYYYAEIEPNLMEGTLEATQDKFIENVENADLISVAIGGGNFLTFAGKYMNRVLDPETNGEPYVLDWERIGVDSTDASMAELQEVLDLLVPVIDALGILDQYLPEGVEIENPAKFARALAEGLIYGFVSYNYYYSKVLDRIKEINPDAQLLVLGMFNPVDDWTMTVNIDGEEKVVNIGGTVSNLMGSANLQSLAYALQNSNTAFIDVSDAETILEAEKPGVQLGFNDYYGSSFKSNGKAVHASVSGHEYIADQMAAALSLQRQIEIVLETVGALVAEYYNEAYAYAYDYAEGEGYIAIADAALGDAYDYLEQLRRDLNEAEVSSEFKAPIDGAIGNAKNTLCELRELVTVADELDGDTYNKAMELVAALETNLNDILALLEIAGVDLSETAYEELVALVNAARAEYEAVKAYVETNLPIVIGMAADYLMEKVGEAYDAMVEAIIAAAEKYGPATVECLKGYLTDAAVEVLNLLAAYGDEAVDFLCDNLDKVLEILDYVVTNYGSELAAAVMEKAEEIMNTMVELVKTYGDEAWTKIQSVIEALDEKVEELPGELSAAAQEAFDALLAAAKKYAPELDDALYNYLYNNPDKVIAFFEAYGPDAIEFIAQYEQEIVAVLGWLLMTYGDDVVDAILANPDGALEQMVAWHEAHGEEAWELIMVYLEELGVIDAIEDTVTDPDKMKAVFEELLAVLEEYGPEMAQEAWDFALEQGYVAAAQQAVNDLLAKAQADLEAWLEDPEGFVNAAVTELQAQLDALKEALAACQNELTNEVLAQIAALQAQLDALNEQLLTATGEVKEQIEAAIAVIEAAIAALEAEAAALEADIAALCEQIAAIEAKIAELSGKVAEVGEKLVALVEQAEALKEALETLVADGLENLEENIGAVVNAISTGVDTIVALAADVQAAVAAAQELAEEIAALIDSVITAVDERINGFAEAVEAINATMAAGLAPIIEALNCLANAVGELSEEAQAQIAAMEEEIASILAAADEAAAAIRAEYEAQIAALEQAVAEAKAALEAKMAELDTAISEELAARKAELEAKIADLTAQLEAKKAELEAKMAELEGAAEEVKAEIEAAIAEIEAVIAEIEAAIADAQAALAEVNAQIQAAVAEIEAAIAELEQALADAEAALNAKIAEVEAAVAAVIAEAEAKVAELQAQIDALIAEANEQIDAAMKEAAAIVSAVMDAVKAEVQTAVGKVVAAAVAAAEELAAEAAAQALAAAGVLAAEVEEKILAVGEVIDGYVNEFVAALEEAYVRATTGEYELADTNYYVALGDGSAVSESYVDLLADELELEEAYVNLAEEGLLPVELLAELAAGNMDYISEIAKADLITVGFHPATFANEQIVRITTSQELEEMDWLALVGEKGMPYVEDALAEVNAYLAESGITGDLYEMLSIIVESYAYSVVSYGATYAVLVDAIHEISPNAEVIIIGSYNAFNDVEFVLGESALPMGEYMEKLTELVNAYMTAYALIAENTTYVDVTETETVLSFEGQVVIDIEDMWGMIELFNMLQKFGDTIIPTEDGHEYIKNQILGVETIIEPAGLKGDVNEDGEVNSRDVRRLLQFVNGRDVEINEYNSMVNGDDEINSRDVRRLLQYVNGRDVVLE